MTPYSDMLAAIESALAPYGDLSGEYEIGAEPIGGERFHYTITVNLVEHDESRREVMRSPEPACACGQPRCGLAVPPQAVELRTPDPTPEEIERVQARRRSLFAPPPGMPADGRGRFA